MLLKSGAHPDRTDGSGKSAYSRLPRCLKPVLSLKCLAAQAFCKRGSLPTAQLDVLPPGMIEFIDLHASADQHRALRKLHMTGKRRIFQGDFIRNM